MPPTVLCANSCDDTACEYLIVIMFGCYIRPKEEWQSEWFYEAAGAEEMTCDCWFGQGLIKQIWVLNHNLSRGWVGILSRAEPQATAFPSSCFLGSVDTCQLKDCEYSDTNTSALTPKTRFPLFACQTNGTRWCALYSHRRQPFALNGNTETTNADSVEPYQNNTVESFVFE